MALSTPSHIVLFEIMSWIPHPDVLSSIAEGKIESLQELVSEPTNAEILRAYFMDAVATVLQFSSTPLVFIEFFQKLARPIPLSSQSIMCDVLWFWGTQVSRFEVSTMQTYFLI